MFYLRITWTSAMEKPRRLPLVAFRSLSALYDAISRRPDLVVRSLYELVPSRPWSEFADEIFEILDADGPPVPAAVIVGEFRRIRMARRKAVEARLSDRGGRAGRGWRTETLRRGPVAKAVHDRPKRKYEGPGTFQSVREAVGALFEDDDVPLFRGRRGRRMLGDNDWDCREGSRGGNRNWKEFRLSPWKT